MDRNEKLILGLIWTLILKFHLKGNTLRDAKQDLANFAGDIGVVIDDFKTGY